jgi:hypothetical protein
VLLYFFEVLRHFPTYSDIFRRCRREVTFQTLANTFPDTKYTALIYLQNWSPHRAIGDMTPEEAFTGQKPPVEHLRIFGCITFYHVPKEKRTKMEPTTEKGLLVGYSEISKAYRLYIPALRRVVVWRDAKFEEERACRRSRELEERQPSTSQQQGSQAQGVGTQSSSTEGTWVSRITGSPLVTIQIGSQGSP